MGARYWSLRKDRSKPQNRLRESPSLFNGLEGLRPSGTPPSDEPWGRASLLTASAVGVVLSTLLALAPLPERADSHGKLQYERQNAFVSRPQSSLPTERRI